MEKEKSQINTKKDSKQPEVKKKLEDCTAEELEAMDMEKMGALFTEAIVDSMNNPDNHDKSH